MNWWRYSYSGNSSSSSLHQKLWEQGVDGKLTCFLALNDGYDELLSAGLTLGEAQSFQEYWRDYLQNRHLEPPGYAYAYGGTGFQYHPPTRPVNVSLALVLHSIQDVDERHFTFNALFTLTESWEDDRIDQLCEGYGRPDADDDPGDRCAVFWKPEYTFPNNLQVEEGQFEVVEDLGFYAMPGANTPWAAAEARSRHINHSIGYRIRRIRAVFLTPMGFYYFPFDCQHLLIQVRMSPDSPRDMVRFVTKAGMDKNLKHFAQTVGDAEMVTLLSGWNVTAIHHREVRANYEAEGVDFGDVEGVFDPVAALVRHWEQGTTFAAEPFDWFNFLVETTPAENGGLNLPYYAGVSEAVFVVQIERYSVNYLYNFALLVALLIGLALMSFLLPNEELGSRLDVSLTVFLGVIFFQIMIVEKLPEGQFTVMHQFMYFSCVSNVVFAFSHACVLCLNAWSEQTRELIARAQPRAPRTAPERRPRDAVGFALLSATQAKALKKNRRKLAAIIKLQRAFRRHQALVRSSQALKQAQAEAHGAGAGPQASRGTAELKKHRHDLLSSGRAVLARRRPSRRPSPAADRGGPAFAEVMTPSDVEGGGAITFAAQRGAASAVAPSEPVLEASVSHGVVSVTTVPEDGAGASYSASASALVNAEKSGAGAHAGARTGVAAACSPSARSEGHEERLQTTYGIAAHLFAAALETDRQRHRIRHRTRTWLKDTARASLLRLVIFINRAFAIVTIILYFTVVLWYVLWRNEGLDAKCARPLNWDSIVTAAPGSLDAS